MRTIKDHLLKKYRQGLDFVSGTHFAEPMYWVEKLPRIENHADIGQLHLLENSCASIKAPVDFFYNTLPRGIFYSLAGFIFMLAPQYPNPYNIMLFIISLGLFAMPHVLTVGDYEKFTSCLDIAKVFLTQNCSQQYMDASRQNQEKKLTANMTMIASKFENNIDKMQRNLEFESTRFTEMFNSLVIKLEKSSPKGRENYGTVPQALLENLIRRRAGYDPSTTIDYSDSRENLVKISNIANKIGCKPENIRTELDNFKTIGSLLSQPTSRLRNCLKYLERIKQSPEYSSNEEFKKQTDYLYKQTRLKISKSHKSM